jgi:hypothetical protein
VVELSYIARWQVLLKKQTNVELLDVDLEFMPQAGSMCSQSRQVSVNNIYDYSLLLFFSAR